MAIEMDETKMEEAEMEESNMKEKVIRAFEEAFGSDDSASDGGALDDGASDGAVCSNKIDGGASDGGALWGFAPGRVNLIGEHTDYNGGHVFPCALTLGTYGVARKRKDRKLRFCSLNDPETRAPEDRGQSASDDGSWNASEDRGQSASKDNGQSASEDSGRRYNIIESSLDDFKPLEDDGWTSYVKGVIWAFQKKFEPISAGLDIMIGGNLPAGSGLSSSASLEVLVGNLLKVLYDFDVSEQEIALIGQEAENNYVGVNCGIMDQFASAMGRQDNAIFLDASTLEYEYVPLSLGSRKLVITNTNKKHALNDSAYNDRRSECSEAASDINRGVAAEAHTIETLGELTPADFDDVKRYIGREVCVRRARHAVTENQRTKDAVAALKAGDLAAFGKLMNESHKSLKDDFEVSCDELDLLAESAWEIPGVIGARMTGGGFGGCTVSIVESDAVEEFCEALGRKYRDAFGYDCTFIIASAGSGPVVGEA